MTSSGILLYACTTLLLRATPVSKQEACSPSMSAPADGALKQRAADGMTTDAMVMPTA